MAEDVYDVIVVGARCAGSPVAMLLARNGYKVLVVDRATFPSDTISTHLIHPPGVAALRRWGLLDRLRRDRMSAHPHLRLRHGTLRDLGDSRQHAGTGRVRARDGPCSTSCCSTRRRRRAPRSGRDSRSRRSCTKMAASPAYEATARAAASVTERARVVVGADGIHSVVARDVVAEEYHAKPPLQAGYYTYWSGLPMNGRFRGLRPRRPVLGRLAHQRRPDPRHRRLADRAVRREQDGHRTPLPPGARAGARVPRPDCGREA